VRDRVNGTDVVVVGGIDDVDVVVVVVKGLGPVIVTVAGPWGSLVSQAPTATAIATTIIK
jgi:hypothetical protein